MKVRAPCAELGPGEHVLPKEVAHYVVRVLRLRAGDAFVAFDGKSAREWDAEILFEDGETVNVRFGASRLAEVRAERPIAWLHGLPKGEKADAIVRDATELGATWIGFAATKRAVTKLEGAKAAARRERWARIAEEAARQCGRGDVPIVGEVTSLEEGLRAARASTGEAEAFCFYEEASEPFGPRLHAAEPTRPFVFVVGPEGGFAAEEAELCAREGFHLVSLGPRILRTETVPAAVLGALLLSDGYERSRTPS
jgi:16S rRNA (uracil1498-N3)-methyltransferase